MGIMEWGSKCLFFLGLLVCSISVSSDAVPYFPALLFLSMCRLLCWFIMHEVWRRLGPPVPIEFYVFVFV